MNGEYLFRFAVSRLSIGWQRIVAWGKRTSPLGTLISIGHLTIYWKKK